MPLPPPWSSKHRYHRIVIIAIGVQPSHCYHSSRGAAHHSIVRTAVPSLQHYHNKEAHSRNTVEAARTSSKHRCGQQNTRSQHLRDRLKHVVVPVRCSSIFTVVQARHCNIIKAFGLPSHLHHGYRSTRRHHRSTR